MKKLPKLLSLLLVFALVTQLFPTVTNTKAFAAAGTTITINLNDKTVRPTSVTRTITAKDSAGNDLSVVVVGDVATVTSPTDTQVTLTATPNVRYADGQTGSNTFLYYYAEDGTTRLTGSNLNGFTFVAWYDNAGERLSMDNVYTVSLADGDVSLRADFGETNLRNQEHPAPPAYNASSVATATAALDLNNAANGSVGYDPTKNIYKELYDKDIANGGDSFYMDRLLTKNADTSSDQNRMWSRGRSLYMNTHTPGTVGFAGNARYIENLSTNIFTLSFNVAGSSASASETTSSRVSTPSHFVARHNIGSSTGITADSTKFISHNNAAVLLLKLNNSNSSARDVTVNVTSPLANQQNTDTELTGARYASNSGVRSNTFYITSYMSGHSFDGSGSDFTVNNTNLTNTVSVPGNGSVELRVVLGATHQDLPDSYTEYDYFTDFTKSNNEVLRWQKANYNRYFYEETPYIDTPNVGINKAIAYRWWSERYNSNDSNLNGYTSSFPTTNEGSNLYNNAIVLTQPMHLQDTKWLRSGYMSYGMLLNAGEISLGGPFLDIQSGNSWNNHYSQYTASEGLNAYKVIGGDPAIAAKFAEYFEGDAKGQLEHYASDNKNLIGYSVGYMPGNDADAISFHYGPNASTSNIVNRPETAYVYGGAKSAATLYSYAGNSSKATELNNLAATIYNSINSVGRTDTPEQQAITNGIAGLWCDEHQMYETRFRARNNTNSADDHIAATSGVTNSGTKYRIAAKESNHYDVFAEYAAPLQITIPTGESTSKVQNTKEALRYLADDRHFMIFPYYTANQFDITRYNISGITNNFSNINFTVAMRAYMAALRYYDVEQEYVTGGMLANSIDWMAWNIYYPSTNANLNTPNNAEYYSNYNRSTNNLSRNNPYHVNLGNYNWLFFEAMAGIIPRLDDKIELDPINLGYDYFMVNNVRYHGKDLTIVWQDPVKAANHYPLAPNGFSLYIDGALVCTFDTLQSFVYDPAAANKFVTRGDNPTPLTPKTVGTIKTIPEAKDVELTDQRVLDNFKKVGIDLTIEGSDLARNATVTASYTGPKRTGAPVTTLHAFHNPGNGTTGYNTDNNNRQNIEFEPAPSTAAINDGTTVNYPFWANNGSTNDSDWVEINFGSPKAFDQVRVWFYGDNQASIGHKEPLSYKLEYFDGTDWKSLPQGRYPTLPSLGMNIIKVFETTASRIRLNVTKQEGFSVAIPAIQVYNTGDPLTEIPEVKPPVVLNASAVVSGYSVALSANAAPDGNSEFPITTKWSVLSKPENAIAAISNANSLNTSLTVSEGGQYILRFEVFQGDLSAYRDVIVNVTAVVKNPDGINIALNRAVTIQAGYDNTTQAGAGTTMRDTIRDDVIGRGASATWNDWSTSNPHWIQYTFPEKLYVSGVEVMWCRDGSSSSAGCFTPSRVDIMYPSGDPQIPMTDSVKAVPSGSTWAKFENLKNRSGNSVESIGMTVSANNGSNTTWHYVSFDPIETQYIKLDMDRQGNGGIAIQEWRCFILNPAETASSFNLRAGVGEDLNNRLPKSYDIKFEDGSTRPINIYWSEEEVSSVTTEENNYETVTVYGSNPYYGYVLEANVSVRPADQLVMLSSYEPMNYVVDVDDSFVAPSFVTVRYNDGAVDSLPVVWQNYDGITSSAGIKTITGTITLPPYVSSGDTTVKLTLNVGNVEVVEGVPVVTDGSGNIITALSSETMITKFTYENEDAVAKDMVMYVAVYSPTGQLLYAGMDNKAAGASQSTEFSVTLNMPDNADGKFATGGYKSKVFLWESGSQRPALPAYIFQ